jgi:hypothetical protein
MPSSTELIGWCLTGANNAGSKERLTQQLRIPLAKLYEVSDEARNANQEMRVLLLEL